MKDKLREFFGLAKDKGKDLPTGKPILCMDFDGVLHSYVSGWQGATTIADSSVEGAMDFLYRAASHFDVQIYSSRSRYWGGRRAMREWLKREFSHYFAEKHPELEWCENPFIENEFVTDSMAREFVKKLKFPIRKPAAFLQIDDRAITFRGKWYDPEELLKFKPWNRRTA